MVSVRKALLAVVDGIETPDDFTVRFVLKQPSPSLLSTLAGGWMVVFPKHILQEKGNMKKDVIGKPFISLFPGGLGPYEGTPLPDVLQKTLSTEHSIEIKEYCIMGIQPEPIYLDMIVSPLLIVSSAMAVSRLGVASLRTTAAQALVWGSAAVAVACGVAQSIVGLQIVAIDENGRTRAVTAP